MAEWGLFDAGRQAMGGQVLGTSALTTVVASATPNQVGGWVQMHSSVPFPVSMVAVFTGNAGIFTSAANTQTLLDVGIGPSPTEQVLIQDVAIGGIAQFAHWHFPMTVPMGARLSMRLRSIVASKSCVFGMRVYGGGSGLDSGYRATTYGAFQTGSRGTVLTTPTVANSKAAWTVISAATTAPMRWLVVSVSAPNTATSSAVNGLIDIGVGITGSEAVLVPDIPFRTSLAEDILAAGPMTYPVSLPAGVRLVARLQQSVVAALGCPTVTLTGIS